MPRARQASHALAEACPPPAGSPPFRVEVAVEGERLLIPCDSGEVSVHWLMEEVNRRYRNIIAPELQAVGAQGEVTSLSTLSGARLDAQDKLSSVADNGSYIQAHWTPRNETHASVTIQEMLERMSFSTAGPPQPASSRQAYSACWQDAVESCAYGHAARVFDLALAPGDSDLLASASDDGTACVWACLSAGGGAPPAHVAAFRGHSDSVLRVTWAPDGRTLATASADTTVRLWRLQGESGCGGVASAPDLATTVDDVGALQAHAEEVYACEWVDGCGGLVTASQDRMLLWDVATGAQLASCGPPPCSADLAGGAIPPRQAAGHVFAARPQPDAAGRLVAAACSDGALRLWARGGGGGGGLLQPLSGARLHCAMAAGCAWDGSGRVVATVATDGSAAAMDVRMMRRLWAGRAPGPLFGCCYVPGAAGLLAAAGADGSVALFAPDGAAACAGLGPDRGGPVASLRAGRTPPRQLLTVAASEDGVRLAAAGDAVDLDAAAANARQSRQWPGGGGAGLPGDGLFVPMAGQDGAAALGGSKVVFSLQGATACRKKRSLWAPLHVWQRRL